MKTAIKQNNTRCISSCRLTRRSTFVEWCVIDDVRNAGGHCRNFGTELCLSHGIHRSMYNDARCLTEKAKGSSGIKIYED
jgi:hypothetical protein